MVVVSAVIASTALMSPRRMAGSGKPCPRGATTFQAGKFTYACTVSQWPWAAVTSCKDWRASFLGVCKRGMKNVVTTLLQRRNIMRLVSMKINLNSIQRKSREPPITLSRRLLGRQLTCNIFSLPPHGWNTPAGSIHVQGGPTQAEP